ncbi:MAG: hypothetical protein H0X46_03200 [Bacteroidetes bacterium]|nr:hypothetical protein [Bacteroidota bacterium]
MRFLILLLITVESIANQQHDFRIKDSEKYKLTLEGIADRVCDKSTLVAINGGESPQLIYFLHRKGWSISSSDASSAEFMQVLISKGCEFLFLDKHYVDQNVLESLAHEKMVYQDEHFIVYSLVK